MYKNTQMFDLHLIFYYKIELVLKKNYKEKAKFNEDMCYKDIYIYVQMNYLIINKCDYLFIIGAILLDEW